MSKVCGSRSGASVAFLPLAVVSLALWSPPALAREGGAPKLTFYPALLLKFEGGEAKNHFLAQFGVVNVSGEALTDLTLRLEFPSGFTAEQLGPDAQAAFKRPEGYQETMQGNVFTVRLPELRIAEATAMIVELSYQGRPTNVTFSGVAAEFAQNGQRMAEKGPDQTWDLAKYTKYSGTIREFVKRYGSIDMRIPGNDDWGFSTLADRAAGRVSTGPVEIESDRVGRMRFSLQAGAPGNLRQVLVMRRPKSSARELKADDEVRRFVLDAIQATADFTLSADEMTISRGKIGRYSGWIADTRWYDRVKDRLGEGPWRWYVFTEPKAGDQYLIGISAQGRGAGPGKADAPNPGRERELMSELEEIVSSIRLL